MAACRNGTGWRRRGVFTLSGVAALAVIAMGVFLWQAVELSSLMTVSQRVDQAKPLLGGLRLTLIGLLALLWPWLRGRADDEPAAGALDGPALAHRRLAADHRTRHRPEPARAFCRRVGARGMSVDSYLELFTTLFGWAFYGVLWDVLVGTGIVYLPFLGILIDNWRDPAEGGEFGTVTGLSLRRMEIELFVALWVVVLAGQPAALTPLDAGTLTL